MQRHRPAGLELLDDEPALGFRRAVGDEVADVDVLQLRDDPVRAGPVQRKQQLIDPAGGVPAGAMPAHLHQPGPHAVGGRVDVDGVIGDDLGSAHDVVAGQVAVARSAGVEP